MGKGCVNLTIGSSWLVMRKNRFLACYLLLLLLIASTLGTSAQDVASQPDLRPLAGEADSPSEAALGERLSQPIFLNTPSIYTSVYSLYLPLVHHLYDSRVRLFGVQVWAEIDSPQARDYMRQAGVRWFRTTISWAEIEPSPAPPSQYNWLTTDERITTMVQAGFNPILTLSDNPSWAAALPGGPVTNTQDLVEFMSTLVERYDGDGYDDAPGSPIVRYWEFYNEPDNTDYGWHCFYGGLGCFGNDPETYAQELAAIYPAMQAASSDAQLVFGGLAMDNYPLFNPNFLDQVLAACTGPCFDIMNFHYYPFFRWSGGWEVYGRDIIGKATAVRNKLALYGYNRPVIVTEASWPGATDWGSSELQARYVPKLYARGMAADLGMLIWYRAVDETCDPVSFMSGLLTCNFDPKPSHTAYSVFTAKLGRADYVGVVNQSDPLIESYQFRVPEASGMRRIDITWVDCTDLDNCVSGVTPPRTYRVAATQVRIIDKFGNAIVVHDCDDGVCDGYVTRQLTDQNPIYVEYLQ